MSQLKNIMKYAKINWQKLQKKALFNLPRFRVHNQFITITRTMYIYITLKFTRNSVDLR